MQYPAQPESGPGGIGRLEATPLTVSFCSSDGLVYSRSDLLEFAYALAKSFEQLGVSADDRIVALLPQGARLFLVTLVCAETAVAMPLSPDMPSSELRRYLAITQPKVALIDAALPEPCWSILRESGVGVISIGRGLTHNIEWASAPLTAGHPLTEQAHRHGILLSTSGTSGEPKLVLLGTGQLQTVAARIAQSIQLTSEDRYLCVMSCHFIHGFSTALAATLSGGSVVFSDGFAPDAVLQQLNDARISWISAAPTHYHGLLRAAERAVEPLELSHLRVLRTASAPMDKALIERLSSCFSTAVIQAYGMTEAGPLIATNTLEADGNRPGSVGRPAGVELAIGEPGLASDPQRSGEICIRGDTVSRDYWSLAAFNGASLQENDGWFRTSDIGHVDKDGFVYVSGRQRDLINAGGEKILPLVIESVLAQHPSVLQAVAYPAPHESLGEAPHAAVVLAGETHGMAQTDLSVVEQIRQHCVAHLPRSHVPHVIHTCRKIPANANGKFCRQGLQAHFADLQGGRAAHAAPETGDDQLERVIIECWRRVLPSPVTSSDNNFFGLGGDSLGAAELTVELEHAFGLSLAEEFVFLWPTIAQQARAVATANARLEMGSETVPEDDAPVHAHQRLGALLPLSAGQKRLWLLDQLGAGAEYTMCSPVWIEGEIDQQVLHLALSEVVARHDALRTRIRALDGNPVQYVEQSLVPEMEFHDLQNTEPGEPERQAIEQIDEFRAHAFELSEAPPVRYALLQLCAQKFAFVLTIHHIICDGWSVPVFYRDLLACYHRHSKDSALELPKIVASFGDYCYARELNQAKPAHREKLDWWHAALKGSISTAPLFPSGRQASSEPQQSAQKEFAINAETTEALKRVASARGLSLYPLLLAALQVAIFAHTRRSRFCVGTVAANRDKLDYHATIGFFANTLAIPADVTADTGLGMLLDSIAQLQKSMAANRDVDLSEIASLFEMGRTGRTNTLVEVMFAYQNYPSLAARLNGRESSIKLTAFTVAAPQSRFALGLYMTPDGACLSGRWQCRRAFLSAADLDAIDRVFQATLLKLAAGTQARVGDLLGRAAPEPAANATPAVAPETRGIVGRVEAFSQSVPTKLAVCSSDQNLSYADLWQEIVRLGSALSAAGTVPATRVGVLVPRSSAAVVAALAVWSRAATYVPLDRDLPHARLAYMVKNGEIEILLCNADTRHLAEELSKTTGLGRLIDYEQPGTTDMFKAVDAGSDACAYIIFTSGSTGLPKGVKISYANLHFYVRALSEALQLQSDDHYLLSASLAFSSSIRQLAVPLYIGASVRVATGRELQNPAGLLKYIMDAGVTVVDLVPSHWHNLLRASHGPPLDVNGANTGQPRLLLSASEALPVDVARRLCAAFPDAQLVNMYGQTETTGIVMLNTQTGKTAGERYVSLGRPVPGNRLEIVDENGEVSREGGPGELIVLGPAVGLGYTSIQPGFADRFFMHNGQSAYRTGDLVRRERDGAIHFIGRADTQLKYRGYRIEPGDIESVARQYPPIEDALACLTPSFENTDQLHLYFTAGVAADQDDQFLTELKSLLARHLPEYMLPTAYTQVDSIPRTVTGKIDRAAVTAGDTAAADTSGTGADDNAMAARLCSIWERALNIDSVGLDDNFFDLGGNSLVSIEVSSRAREAGIALSLEQLFQHQTIKALAAVVQPIVDQQETIPSGSPGPKAVAEPGPVIGEEEDLPRYDVASLRNFSEEVLRKAGLAEDGVRILTEVQLESSLRGQLTHNIGDVPRYAKRLSQGVLNGQPSIAVTELSKISASIDGDNAPGQWVATVAMNKAIALAKANGIGMVGVRRSNHYGAAGHYAWQAAQAGLLSLCFTNGPVILAPTGGNEPLFGNNPLAVGIPRHDRFPIILDMAMSVATRGKIGLTVAEGKPLDAGWILDSLGMPSTSLEDLAAGLAAPIGGHKGYGLAFIIEILAGALSGSGYCADHSGKVAARHGGSDIGHLFITFKSELLMPAAQFTERVEHIVAQTKSSRKINGVEEIFVPGEIEMKARDRNLKAGIALPASSVQRLIDYARRFDIRSQIIRVSQ